MTTCPLHPEQPTPCAPCGVNRVRAALGVAPRTRRDGRSVRAARQIIDAEEEQK